MTDLDKLTPAQLRQAVRELREEVCRVTEDKNAVVREANEYKAELEKLTAVIRDVHSDIADDLCWMSIDRIFVAAGLPVPERWVGDKFAMLKNCGNFIETMCQGGKWVSYKELRALLAEVLKLNVKLCVIDHRGLCLTHLYETPCLYARIGEAIKGGGA